MSMTTDPSASPRAAYVRSIYLLLLWLAGMGLRLTILAPAPVISLIHDDLGLSETQIGLLSGIPAALFACAAIAGSLLIARFGALTTLIVGLIATAVGSALRGAAFDVSTLYITTAITGFGVAVMQPSLPSLVRSWLPDKISLATAAYINGLLMGEVLPVALTSPFVLPLVGSWRSDFAVWGGACMVIAAIVFALAPNVTNPMPFAVPRKWWPDWRNRLIWKLGVMMGSVSATYFSTNFFIPRYLHATGHSATTGVALTALNICQIPASLLLLFIGRDLQRRVWPYFGCGLLSLAAVLSIVFGDNHLVIVGAGALGFASAVALILMLALPSLLSPPDDVHRTAAAMLTIGYSCAVIVPVFSGIAWDVTGLPAMAFVPITLCSLALIAMTIRDRTRLVSKQLNLHADGLPSE